MAFLAIAEMPAYLPNHPTPAIAGTRWDELGGTIEAVVCGSAGVPGETRLQLQWVVKDAAENELPRHHGLGVGGRWPGHAPQSRVRALALRFIWWSWPAH